MGLLDTVRAGVDLANRLTTDLQATVTHKVFVSSGGAGKSVYTDVPRKALVTRKQRLVRSSSGDMSMSQAQVVFLDPGVVVKELDKIVLPDGTSGPILNTDGFVDAGTGKPILTQVYLG